MKPKFTIQDIKNKLEKDTLAIEQSIIALLHEIGENIISDARQSMHIDGAFSKGDYTDRTANLRNSLGYFILHNGNIVSKGFSGNRASEAMQALTHAPNRKGFTLIVLAGMEYALAVESKGYNVLTSQWYYYMPVLDKKLKDLAKKI